MRRKSAVLAVLLAALSGSCADPNKVAALEKKTSDLEKRESDLDAQLKTLTESVQTLRDKESLDELTKTLDSVAYLTPGNDGYTVIQADLGRMTVQLVDVQPYANGSRVTLRFGNMTSAIIHGAKATLEWGAVDNRGSANNETAKSREVKFTETLRAGAWTSVRVVLEGVAPTELGFVRVRNLTHTGIGLTMTGS
jgi:hypothetical protein